MKAKNKLGLVFFPAFDWAISPTHPEREERLLYTQDQLFEEGIEDIENITFYNPLVATEADVQRVHFCVPTVKARVTQSHLIAAGGTILALQKVMEKEVDKAFALVRPPGHHAHRVVHGSRGFCTINTEAIMLEKIREEYGPLKVAIVDTDCHHGDGTQDIYWNDPDTLFISLHQDGRTLYPGSGFVEECGGPAAYGYNINVPLPPGTGEEGFLYVIDHLVLPILAEYKPDLIINSAGQDNHYTDPLTRMNFTAQGYAKLNQKLSPHVAVLEGGYSIEGGLPYVNLGIILALAGLDFSEVKEPDYRPEALQQPKEISDYIARLCDGIYQCWRQKEQLRQDQFKGLTHFERNRRIYYDTDGIVELQRERFKICNHCPGLNIIDSHSDQGHHILAVTIPRGACAACLDEGYKVYREAGNKYSQVYLQDRVNDCFLSR